MQKQLTTLIIILLTALSASLSAAPVGYSVNSDSGSEFSDGLYTIDLDTGQQIERIGTVQSNTLQRRIDVEGLAFAPDGKLYGVDDDSLKLFSISLENALVDPSTDYDISDLTSGNNDFGMTFACDGSLYVTSVADQSLYRLGLDGQTQLVGGPDKGGLGHNISALAAYGIPVQLYGLSNGTAGEEKTTATPTLYSIDTKTGVATEVDALSGSFGAYAESGLAFDEFGDLWAMTDRRADDDLPSQVMRIDKTSGVVSAVKDVQASTVEESKGFESLAISAPLGCTATGNGETADFFVQKRFADGNNVTPFTVNFQCTGGTVFVGTRTIFPSEDNFGIYEVMFTVDNIPAAPISCEIWEDVPAGYTPEYSCQSESSCTTSEGIGPCTFDGITTGQQDLCVIRDDVDAVELTVTKQWDYVGDEEAIDELAIADRAKVELFCEGVVGGDGQRVKDLMRWKWLFEGSPDSHVAMVVPAFDERTHCWTEERIWSSEVESESTCSEPILIEVGDDKHTCTITNTVFFEGIPTLNLNGLVLITALMLLTGMIAMRRMG